MAYYPTKVVGDPTPAIASLRANAAALNAVQALVSKVAVLAAVATAAWNASKAACKGIAPTAPPKAPPPNRMPVESLLMVPGRLPPPSPAAMVIEPPESPTVAPDIVTASPCIVASAAVMSNVSCAVILAGPVLEILVLPVTFRW